MESRNLSEQLLGHHEILRVRKLHRYEILDTPPEAAFDTIARLALRIMHGAAAYVTFVDSEFVFVKANTLGMPDSTIKRSDSLCSIAVLDENPTLIPDTSQLAVPSPYPVAMYDQDIRFYAAAPITTSDGHRIGNVCVTDIVPRHDVSVQQLEMLELLAFIVVEKLEIRIAGRKTIRAYDDRLHRMVHDIKNPITSISMYAQIMDRKTPDPDKLAKISNKIQSAAKSVEQHLNNILNEAKLGNEAIHLTEAPVQFAALADTLRNTFELALGNKRQELVISQPDDLALFIDRERVQDVLDNLLSNAIKYSPTGSRIDLIAQVNDGLAIIEFRDQGVGLTQEDLQKVFVKFAKLSSVPTANERSNGLGLSIVKMLVELHGGQVWAHSAGRGHGSSFFLTLPVYKAPSGLSGEDPG